ncbi:hypothetical protein L5G32_17950 [Gordonia sp. HY002]|uniref:hypothetical protein n=1 Tax=Gordonia zhenghanii TaxID=2911516 RepID=UPI001EEFAC49|nr:hypothetical protein [Gordonia zhenghanii]MCF8572146.1 hypothetical protein [Gordonia zhenghanii]MCF8604270.1 hypothetical protein [Gordonia zhenghanii]
MHDESSPTTYRFAMNVPPGGHTKVNPDGSAIIYDKDGNAIRQVARPWAFDAAGRPQKTWYTVDENGDLIQHLEPADNAIFPILADPWVYNGEGERVWVDQDTLDLMPGITPNLDTANTQDAPPADIPPGGGVTAQDIPDVLADPPSPGNPTITSSGNTWSHEQGWNTNPDGSVTGSNIYAVTPRYGDPVVTETPLTAEQQGMLTTLVPNSRVETRPDGQTVFVPTTSADGLTAQDITNLTVDMPEPGEALALQNGGTATVTRTADGGLVYDTLHVNIENGQTLESTTLNKSLSIDRVEQGTSPANTPSVITTMKDGSSETRYTETLPELGNRTLEYLEVRDTQGKLIYTLVTWEELGQEFGVIKYGDGSHPEWTQDLRPEEIATLSDPTPEESLRLRETIGEHVRSLENSPDDTEPTDPGAAAELAGVLVATGSGLSTRSIGTGPATPWILGGGLLIWAAGAAISTAIDNTSSDDRGDGRNELGQFAGPNGAQNGKAAEQQGLDELQVENPGLIRDQKRATVPGVNHGRYYDGLIPNRDGTYTGVEIKSGNGTKSANQRAFDDAVSPENPAKVKLSDGREVDVVRVRDVDVPAVKSEGK